jgi:hypothetical protein
VLLDPDLRARLKERGRIHVQSFSWEKSVQRVLELYRSASTPNAQPPAR